MNLLVFYGLCALGWKGFEKLRIPTPTILGPMVIVCAANLLGLPVSAPFWFRPSLSLLMGVMIGLRFNLRIKGLLKEIILAVVWIVSLSLITAKVLQWAGLDASTALFAAMPGGLAEISLIAISFHAETFTVALLQTTRLLATMFIIPVLAGKLPPPSAALPADETPRRSARLWDLMIIAVLAVSSAFLLERLGMPAAMLIGPMLAVGGFTRLRSLGVKPPVRLQQLVQIGVGGLVGVGVSGESLRGAGRYLLPILYLNVLIVGGSLLLALLLHKLSGWDKTTCLLSVSPAGLSPTILLSIELRADTSKVALFQVLRMATVLLLAPSSAQLLLR